jgi:hypothetical protein
MVATKFGGLFTGWFAGGGQFTITVLTQVAAKNTIYQQNTAFLLLVSAVFPLCNS